MHYAQIYQERIAFLERKIRDYYMANWDAKAAIGGKLGVCGIATLEGNEESMAVTDVEGLKSIINDLPLWDCGC